MFLVGDHGGQEETNITDSEASKIVWVFFAFNSFKFTSQNSQQDQPIVIALLFLFTLACMRDKINVQDCYVISVTCIEELQATLVYSVKYDHTHEAAAALLSYVIK